MVSRYKSVPHNPAEIFKLKPLLACMRMVIASGMFLGSLSTTHAENVLPEAADKWVTSGSATKELLGNALNINQQSDRAVLNWKSFNVGEKNAVNFQQLSSSSIALNRIGQNDPSRILGKITANGQIYLYNQNGFVFGKDSSVNVNTLVATALNVSDDVVLNRSIVTEFDNNRQAAAFSGKPGSDTAITIEAGAKIKVGENGRLIMAAPNINNAGNLEADKFGQIILVASKDKVYLQPAAPDSPFAGLLVEVDTGGKVSNIGQILARQGNVTLAGFAVNQGGRVSATTSVSVNGSIRLLARERHALDGDSLVATSTTRTTETSKKLNDGLGTESKVTFASGSVTEVIADADGGSAIDEQEQPLPYIEAFAHTVHLQSGSAISSPGGQVNITATGAPLELEKNSVGRILLEDGAVIDVSGNKNISASVERNVVDLSVQSFELRDSPLQKGGVLQGQTIKVDIRKENPIVDISGALARVERGIDERLGKGGTVNLTSSGDVIVNSGAKVDISGGTVNYQGGYINTTKLLTNYGKVIDIADANPDEHYRSIFGVFTEEHSKWGVTEVWQSGLIGKGIFEPGYQQGLDAGALNIETTRLSWNGDLTAGSVSGLLQREPAVRPFGGSLVIDTKTFSFNQSIFNSAQNVQFGSRKGNVSVGIDDVFPTREDRKPVDLVLSNRLINRSGLQQLTVKALGQATIKEDASISMGPNGEFGLVANGIDVAGNIYTPGGKISLSSGFDAAAAEQAERTFNASAPLKLATTANLDVSGRWVNDFALGLSATPTQALAIDAGSVDLRSTGDLTTEAGSTIAANGGAWFSQNEQLTAGEAGSIGLLTLGGAGKSTTLNLQGQQSAYGLLNGGSLLLRSGKIVVGAEANLVNNPLVLAVTDHQLNLAGIDSFGDIQLQSHFDDVVVKAQTSLSPIQKNPILQQDFRDQTSGKSLLGFSNLETLPEHLRNPVNISLAAANNVRLETGSRIMADKQADISLSATLGGIYVDGRIDAPAGSINLTIADPENPYDPKQAIWLGSNGQLTATGTTRMNPLDGLSRRTGQVLDGGTVALTAKRGYVVLEEGSKIDVSGTQATLDLLSEAAGDNHFVATEVGSNAGKIQLTAAEGVVLDGDLTGRAGTATTRAGRFELTLDRVIRNPPQGIIGFPFGPITVDVQQHFAKTLADDVGFGDNLDKLGLNGKALISADKITEGGFSDLRLATFNILDNGSLSDTGSVRFLGDVNLTVASSIDLDTPNINWQSLTNGTAGTVSLNTAYFRAGSSTLRETAQLPRAGEGKFTVHSQWTQLEGLSRWNGFNTINLNSEHDLRTLGVLAVDSLVDNQQNSDYRGELVTAANLNLTASQIYPSTLSKFTFAIENNPGGKITVSGSGNTDTSPLSAAGELTFKAPVIEQNGVVKAPFGTINMTASNSLTLGAGSLTSVSGADQLIPFGVTFSGLDWLYPIESTNILVFDAPPEKKLVLSGPEVVLEKGSTVDLSGGGDLLAYEFQPGIGGSFDYLASDSPSYQGGFAVVPSLGSALAPYDHLQKSNYQAIGSQVYLSGTDALPAGFYTLLPARYALLPGAFLVTPVAGNQDQRIATVNVAGLSVVPGYRTQAGTGTRDPRWSGFLIESGADIRKRSQYDEQTANDFYTQRAVRKDEAVPLLPVDSGQIGIQNVQTKLSLEGDLKVVSPGGRGARMDIAANRLRIVNTLSAAPTAGVLEILADDLTDLHVDSLLLGGSRDINRTTGATEFNITSTDVTFAHDAHLQGADLIAAANNKITVEKGAELKASGTVRTGDFQFDIKGDGVLLRVSADDQVTLNRTATNGVRGELAIEAGSSLSSTKSILLDASQSTRLAGDIQMQGGSLNLSANAINLGEVDGIDTTALNLSNEKLLNLAVDELILNSRNGISFYGNFGQRQGSSGTIAPISFNRLVLNASGFEGFGASDQSVNIKAQTLELGNPRGIIAAKEGTGQSQLNIFAGSIQQGEGVFGITGFSAATISVDDGFNAVGNATLNVAADLHLTTGYLSTTDGKDLAINVQGQARFDGNASAAVAGVSYGGAIDIAADAIVMNAKVSLPSGRLGLRSSRGDILVGGNAKIDLSGDAVPFADVNDYTPGGVFNAVADKGKITLAEGSQLDLNPGGGSVAGGQLILRAEKQGVQLLGQISANSGSVVYDVANFGGNAGFDELVNKLSTAGITDSIYIRAREAGIEQTAASSMTAHGITLVADRSTINVSGKINANGQANDDGGTISLYAGDAIALTKGAEITARGNGSQSKGGKVILSSTDADNDQQAGITIGEGASIDVKGKGAANGTVVLRALRTDRDKDGVDDGIAIAPIKGKILGVDGFYAEGVKKYGNQDLGNDGAINLADIAKIKADTDAYMSAAVMKNVDGLADGIRLRPGIEINYQGDLILKEKWDLVDWRYGAASGAAAVPGAIGINATGNLTFQNSLTDGFRTVMEGAPAETRDILQTEDSWSYQLAAGADLSSADKTAVSHGAANLTIGKNTVIRTGTGDLNLSASSDVVFVDQTSSVYSAGKAEKGNRYGSFGDIFVRFGLYAEYPLSGGNLIINAGNDIKGALNQAPFVNNWLIRPSKWGEQKATAWGIHFARFDQNVGSFGGGNVTINAGGNIDDLAVMMPTTGKQIGQQSNPNNQFSEFKTNVVQIGGGGFLQVNAGADIAGGVYYLGRGEGRISASGDISGASKPQEFSSTVRGLLQGPQILMGDTQLEIIANNGISLAAVSDPMILHDKNTNFFSYSEDSAIQVKSLSGDVVLDSDTSVITSTFQATTGQTSLSKVYPASLFSTAFGGDVLIGGGDTDIILFPSGQGNLNLFAQGEIAAASRGIKRLGMSDFDSTLLPDIAAPLSGTALQSDKNNIASFLNPFSSASAVHAQRPSHRGDDEPVRIATQQGDIRSLIINLPKKAIVQSGHDFNNVSLAIQHANLTGDASILSATRDIIYQTNRLTDFGTLESNTNKLEIGGPGDVLIKSGRNIDLGTSIGLSTVGNTFNPNLPGNGANVTVLAGLNGAEPNYLGLLNLAPDVLKYAEKLNDYQQLVTQFMRERTGNTVLTVKSAVEQFNELAPSDYASLQPTLDALVSDKYQNLLTKIQNVIVNFVREQQGHHLSRAEALAAFKQLAPQQYLPIQTRLNTLANRLLFSELNETGSASASDPTLGNERGFAAIEALYPGTNWKGDLNLFFSKLQTLKDGSINLLVPGGNINAGLAVVANDLQKSSSDLGIVAQGKGDINAFVNNDFIVNQSRVFALAGGDILIWSSEGDIDAGRGAKSAIAAPPPIITFDESGNLVIDFPPIVSGSGIRTAAPIGEDIKAGNVALFAPGGIVDAGEAGIAGNNVTISATAVLGANNISVGGIGTGVPASSSASLAAGLTGVSNLTANVSQVAQASADISKDNEDAGASSKNMKLGSLSVELVGFGEGSTGNSAEDRKKRN